MIPVVGVWLDRIRQWIDQRPARFLLYALAANGAFLIAFNKLGRLPAGGPEIVDLQLSWSPAVFQQIATEWSPDALRSAHLLLFVDLGFPIAYVTLFAGLFFLASQGVAIEPKRLIQYAPFAAGVADLVENAIAIWLLRDLASVSAIGVRVMWLASMVKLTLLALTAGFVLAALLKREAWRAIRTARYAVLSLAIGTLPLLLLGQGRDLLVALANDDSWLHMLSFTLALLLWAFSTWYWSRALLDAEASRGESKEFCDWAIWLPRWVGALTLFIPGAAMLIELNGSEHWLRMLGLGLLCATLGAAFLWFVIKRRRLFDVEPDARVAKGYSGDEAETPLRRAFIASMTVSLTVFVVFVFAAQTSGFALGATAILALAAANTVFFGSVAVFATEARRVPVEMWLIVVAVIFSLWNDNHLIEVSRPLPARDDITDNFTAWAARAPASGSSVTAVIVTGEGGGIRAAYWTSAVLHALDDWQPQTIDFSRRLYAISSVSGSSFGAAVYASLKKDRQGATHQGETAKAILRQKFLAPMVAKLVTGDLAQWFWPFPIKTFDRSPALVDGFVRAYRGQTGTTAPAVGEPLTTFGLDRREGVPALFFNSTSVRTGRRVVASTLRWRGADDLTDPVDFHQLVSGDVTVAAAAHNTARFPLISAAGLLRGPRDEYLGHLVDGGYFENTGAETAFDVITRLKAVPVPGRTVRFVVVAILNSSASADERNGAWRRSHYLGEVLSPLRTLFYTRDARGLLASERLSALVRTDQENYIEIRPCNGDSGQRQAPLGWQLSDEMIALMDAQLADGCVQNKLAAVAAAILR
jgi:hypothetical protein